MLPLQPSLYLPLHTRRQLSSFFFPFLIISLPTESAALSPPRRMRRFPSRRAVPAPTSERLLLISLFSARRKQLFSYFFLPGGLCPRPLPNGFCSSRCSLLAASSFFISSFPAGCARAHFQGALRKNGEPRHSRFSPSFGSFSISPSWAMIV